MAALRELDRTHTCAVLCAEAAWWRRRRRTPARFEGYLRRFASSGSARHLHAQHLHAQPLRRGLQPRHIALTPLASGQQLGRFGGRHPEGGADVHRRGTIEPQSGRYRSVLTGQSRLSTSGQPVWRPNGARSRPMNDQSLYLLTEAADRTGLTVEALRQRIKRGKLDAVKGNDGLLRVRLTTADLEELDRSATDQASRMLTGQPVNDDRLTDALRKAAEARGEASALRERAERAEARADAAQELVDLRGQEVAELREGQGGLRANRRPFGNRSRPSSSAPRRAYARPRRRGALLGPSWRSGRPAVRWRGPSGRS